jgi:hypothetical protein
LRHLTLYASFSVFLMFPLTKKKPGLPLQYIKTVNNNVSAAAIPIPYVGGGV